MKFWTAIRSTAGNGSMANTDVLSGFVDHAPPEIGREIVATFVEPT